VAAGSVHEGSGEPGVHRDSQVRREVAGGGLANPAQLGIPSRSPRRFQHERHRRKGHVVPAALGLLTHVYGRPVSADVIPEALQGGGESDLGTGAILRLGLFTSGRCTHVALYATMTPWAARFRSATCEIR
jgi:hypothetical protein